MSPDGLAVELDRLLEGGRSLETARLMQAAASGRLQTQVAVAVRERLMGELISRSLSMRNSWEREAFDFCARIIGMVDLTPIIERCSSPQILEPDLVTDIKSKQ